jgi:hypothetical protein
MTPLRKRMLEELQPRMEALPVSTLDTIKRSGRKNKE